MTDDRSSSDDLTVPFDLSTTRNFDNDSSAPDRIGPYRILQKIGEGGMGEVYEAEQEAPVRRRVAIKIIKWGMDTKQVIARFEAERQALAMMNHPNIAKVFDAGATEQGRPYFVMEFVSGVSITEHCDRHCLSTPERLDLFMRACEGVQHAHQNAVIHRDLKPSNILVAIHADQVLPKIIDFGLAKATAQRLTEQTLFTQQGQMVGTPEYMSPEQAEMTGQNVDTRTDVYSLGVVLYELLVGALPFDAKALRKIGFDEIRRTIREEEPSKPSTRVSTLGDASTGSARKRRTDPASLVRQLRGDLDWITMKALAKDRTRRYASPTELAADIQRHLKDEPVLAGPPSTTYRMGKFFRRHRIGVTIATAAVVFLVGFAARERIQSRRISIERDRANQEAATAQQVSEFLVALFGVSDPSEARGNSITAREILDRGAKEIDQTLADQPVVQAELMGTMGRVYRELGLFSQAALLLERAVEIRKRMLGEDHPDTLHSMNNLAILYADQGRSAEAESLYLETLESMRRVLGNDHQKTLGSVVNLAVLYVDQGRYAEAEPLYIESLEKQERILGKDHPETLKSRNNLAVLYQNQGRSSEAEPLYVETLRIRTRVLGDDHPNTLLSMNNLAYLYSEQGRYDEAEPLFLDALETQKRALGDEHPDTLLSLGNLAHLYKATGELDEARPVVIELLAFGRKAAEGPNASPSAKGAYAWDLLTCEPADLRNPEIALKFAMEADEESESADPYFLDTLALAYHLTGDTTKAIVTQRKAISVMPVGDSPFRKELEEALKRFEAALTEN